MRKVVTAAILVATGLGLSACGGGGRGGVFAGRAGPDEFAVARQQPLVVPPDFALVPPRPGAPRPQETDSATQALQAMFGGSAQRSPTEQRIQNEAGAPRAEAGIRSEAGDPATETVDKGAATRTILQAPPTQGQDATAQAPGGATTTTPPQQ